MPRIHFYNRRFASRAPVRAPSLETTCRFAVGKPRRLSASGSVSSAAFPPAFESYAGPPRGPRTVAVIQPPAVARLTARRPASGHAAIPVHDGEGACARTSSWLSRGIETAAALSAGGRFCRANPLTPLFTSGALAAGAAWFAIRRARFNQGTSMQPIFPSSEVPSAGEVRCPRPLRARSMERCPRWPARGAAARVHRSFRKLESFEGSD